MPTYPLRSGFPKLNTTNSTQAVTLTNVGDLIEVIVHIENGTTNGVASMSDTASKITWHTSAVVIDHQATYSNNRMEIWYGIVKATGSTTIQTNWQAGTTFDRFIFVFEWGPPTGITNPAWSAVAAGGAHGPATGHTMLGPTLLSSSTGGVYCWYVYTTTATGIGTAGSTPGFTYQQDAFDNILAWNKGVAASTHIKPTAQQTPATADYNGIAAIFKAVTSGGGGTPSASVSDTAHTVDSVGRVGNHPRTKSDSAATSDSPARKLGSARAIAEGGATGDSVTRGLSMHRTIADVAASGDVPARVAAYQRLVSDAAAGADTVGRNVALPLATTDAAATADGATAASTGNVSRPVADNSTTADGSARVPALGRPASDGATTANGLTRADHARRSVTDTAANGDGTARSQNLHSASG